MSEDKKPKLLFHNPALIDLLYRSKIAKSHTLNLNNDIEEILYTITVKRTEHNDSDPTFPMINLIEDSENIQQKAYFIANSESLVQLKIHKLSFQNVNARLIFFNDCSGAQTIEQVQSENKFKTLLLSTTSHEIRTPISAVMGVFDLIKPHLPEDKQKYIEIGRQSCEMIVFHINDLTVIYFILCLLGLWKNVSRSSTSST